MKSHFVILRVLLAVLVLSMLSYCTKEALKEAPTVTALEATNITSNSAIAGGKVTADGGNQVTAKGICWSPTNTSPTTSDSKTSDGLGMGAFASSMSGLLQGTTYYFRAYAINSIGTAYSNAASFKTLAVAPVLTTTDFSSVTASSFISGGNISSDGGSLVTARGVCWSTNQNPTIVDTKTSDGTGIGSFTSSISGLTPGMTYYARAYATNSVGSGYGNQITIKTITSSPVVTTTAISAITSTTASSGGNVTSDGGVAVTARGVCWSTTSSPTIANNKTSDGTGTGAFTSSITGLAPGATYYVRAYATNSLGTGYGAEVSFSAATILSTITTTAITNITSTTASGGGNITADGGGAITARGVCWGIASGPTITNSKTTDGTGTGAFASSITGLAPGTTYYVRSYSTNSAGTVYGTEVTFTTKAILATITTTAISNIAATTATGGGNLTSDGGATVTARGVCWGKTTGPTTADSKTTDATGTGVFTSSITGLSPGSTYYVRSYATNSAGTVYGSEVTFSALATLPTISTNGFSNITASSATGGGNITSDGGAAITARGVCWGATSGPTTANSKTNDGTGNGNFTSSITGLTVGATYYIRAFATNSAGISYGNELTLTAGAATDIDGNVYSTVTIGTQVWMVENLKVSKYRNGDPISGNDQVDNGKFGKLYSYDAANDDRSIAPAGWHLPTNVEWSILDNFVASNLGTAGSVAKALSSKTDWASSNNAGAVGNDLTKNNTTGFTALPGGYSDGYSSYWASDVSKGCAFWSIKTDIYNYDDHWFINYGGADLNAKNNGYACSIRCIKGEVITLTTVGISSNTGTTAVCEGNVFSDGGANITERGICWKTDSYPQTPTITNSKAIAGNGTGVFTSTLTGLLPGTTYNVRAYATNSVGTFYGRMIQFKTIDVPNVTTTVPSPVNSTTATSGGNITPDGGAAITTRGVCWSTKTNPTIADNKTSDGSGVGTFSSSITGLTPNTTYYIRAYATNIAGTGYGQQVSIVLTGPVTDADGNTYSVVTINNQVWMASNLKTTKYNDGTAIPLVTDNTAWSNLATPGYCWYNNDAAANKSTYGAFYNWYTVGTQKLCPTGWRVPSDTDWDILSGNLGGKDVAGGKLKETGTIHWLSPNTGAVNTAGFTAVPGGYRLHDGSFHYLGSYGYWWSSWSSSTDFAYYRSMDSNSSSVEYYGTYKKWYGFSVRCIRNN